MKVMRRRAQLSLVMPLALAALLPIFIGAAAAPAPAFRAEKLREIDAAVDEAIAAKKLPGGVLWIEHRGETYHRAYGNRELVPAVEPMTEDTIFDAASLTKVIATGPSIWLLIRDG
jgi:CubicO group peptidase (beta-lactamase class C family)